MSVSRDTAVSRLDALAQKLAGEDLVTKILEVAKAGGFLPYLVGGMLRDAVLGRESADMDLAVKQGALEFAQDLSMALYATYVPLDEINGSARVVMSDGSFVDITDFRRSNIRADCLARDLTCNALAAPLGDFLLRKSDAVIDPAGALDDIAAGIIRTHREENLREDPLRILRIFRYQATLGFSVADETLVLAERHSDLLKSAAPERVESELFQLFASDNAAPSIDAMQRAGVWAALFPFVKNDDLKKWVALVENINALMPDYADGRDQDFLHVLYLSALAHFNSAKKIAAALRLSTSVTRRMSRITEAMPIASRLLENSADHSASLSNTVALAVLLKDDFAAPWMILAGLYNSAEVHTAFLKARELANEKIFPLARKKPLVNGSELADVLSKKPGPWVSKMLDALFFLRLEGKIVTKEQAIAAARKLVKNDQ